MRLKVRQGRGAGKTSGSQKENASDIIRFENPLFRQQPRHNGELRGQKMAARSWNPLPLRLFLCLTVISAMSDLVISPHSRIRPDLPLQAFLLHGGGTACPRQATRKFVRTKRAGRFA